MKTKQMLILALLLALGLQSCNLPGGATPTAAMEETAPGASTESAPAAIPTEAANIPAEAGWQPQSACDHPYFPVRTGATWTYRDPENDYDLRWEITEVSGDLESATAYMSAFINTAHSPNEDLQIDYTWQCTASKGILSYDYGLISALSGSLGPVTVATLENNGEGVMFPPEDQFVPGASWKFSGNSLFSLTQADIGNVQARLESDETYTVLETTTVEIAGNTYDAVRLQRDYNGNLTLIIAGMSRSQPINMTSTYVLARGVGMVSIINDTDMGRSGVELVDFYLP